MVDVFTNQKRSEVMSKIRSKDTKPEIMMRKALYSSGIRGYRVRLKLPGRPDIVFTSRKLAIFIDGCFWHGCPKCYSQPETNKDFWINKLNENRKRDKKAVEDLERMGWKVIRFWEHEIEHDLDKCIHTVKELLSKINGSSVQPVSHN